MEPTRSGWNPYDEPDALIPRVLAEHAVFPLYQPIIDLATRTVVGAEALARGPAGSPVEFPDALFTAATRAGLLPLLDQLCATRAMEIARDAPDGAPPLLFINAEPAALSHPFTPELVDVINSERPYRTVLEFTERALASHPAALLAIASQVHQTGGALALDDVGADPLSLAFLPLVEPEVVKLDMHLLRNPHARHTVETAAMVSAHAERCGAVVLAEGIETEEDLLTAQALGARWGQGWLFGRPAPLSAISGLPVHHSTRLRSPRPELHLPSGTPFNVASARHRSRAGDQRTIDGLIEYLLSLASNAGPYSLVLGAYPDPVVGRSWLPRLASLAGTAAFVGISGPALAGADPHPVRAVPVTGPADAETALAVVGPQGTAALCVRPGPGDSVDFVLTHDPDLVHAVARMLLWRMGSAAGRTGSPADHRWGSTVAAVR
ncbi:EAL domain-containing protein [Planomonospora sp. ID67723]|uniref:EAL domain-containing protein n=1 Tax=Planomonospora sp. ID67723 TaxID=2738134 RepID=UPI0018C41D61|nr:EAL domain-containing protein [Planomonospora sp. ID67723]MBG0827682.1 EAL domain-containing protein [Planomonospora sp. ID67723]